MNIGVDIDGVLTDLRSFEVKKGEAFFNREVSNPNGYEICDLFCVSPLEGDKCWSTCILEYITDYTARENASKITHKLHDEGNKIIIITARRYDPDYTFMKVDEMPKYVEKWLKNNDIYYDKIIFSGPDKKQAVKENNIEYMIEDSPKNIIELNSLCKVIVFNEKYNYHINGKNIYRVNNWNEIYDILKSKK